ncbi:hypothetical protein BI308_23205 [Roseofilum reptotaenium AO1-A]|uniref:Uncharacterized protein n=1 Tax=Roseofilum reptotaenium AO1-A TaxID=1925591 RepID=A0A1L9QKJ5_9CYAN|nr:hypothetical protein BI308_23205 [Roseofilum reptotaenium AO1-A]
METLIDGIGEWEQLGGLSLDGSSFDWQYVNLTNAVETFRIKWEVDWEKWWGNEGYRSWIYLRFRYPATGDVSQGRRLYPSEEKSVFSLELPGNVYVTGSSEIIHPTREIWVRHWISYRKKPWVNLGSDPIILPINFTLEGLLPLS